MSDLPKFVWEYPTDYEKASNYYSVYVGCKNCGNVDYLFILKGQKREGFVNCPN